MTVCRLRLKKLKVYIYQSKVYIMTHKILFGKTQLFDLFNAFDDTKNVKFAYLFVRCVIFRILCLSLEN